MKKDRLPLIVLVVALAALAGTAAWAAVAASGSKTTNSYYGSMMGSGGLIGSAGTMMGYTPAGAHRVDGPAEAKRLAQRFAERLGLKTDEVLQFERNFYVKLVDKKGNGATEVLVDPQTGAVTLEYGPAMMWNTRYGLHGRGTGRMMGSYGVGMMNAGGMMGNASGMMSGGTGMMSDVNSSAAGTRNARASFAQAHRLAQRWLDANRPGIEVEAGGDTFPGYRTFEILRQGKIEGMLSVNGYTGAVIYHWWHGAFVRELA